MPLLTRWTVLGAALVLAVAACSVGGPDDHHGAPEHGAADPRQRRVWAGSRRDRDRGGPAWRRPAGDDRRWTAAHVPPRGADDVRPDSPASLVLTLHGSGGTAEIMSVYAAMPSHAAAGGVITVTPDAIEGSWELTGEGADDELLMALLDDIEGRYCIDLDRVHVAGLCLGALGAATAPTGAATTSTPS